MVLVLGVLSAAVVGLFVVITMALRAPQHRRADAGINSNPALDPGTTLDKRAAGFTLTDQFGRQVSLSSFRGRVVLLAFVDSKCTTVCPLTTSALADAKQLLGAAGPRVELLGINANPVATSIADVRSFSRAHGLNGLWHFLTGPRKVLKRVWRSYGIAAEVEHNQIDHTPAMFAIDPAGIERKVYLTQMNFTTVQQLGEVMAREASRLLPGHPKLRASLPEAALGVTTPGMIATLPRAGGGTLSLSPKSAPRLTLFFASWAAQSTALTGALERLNAYARAATANRLPELVAVDEAPVEPSPNSLRRYLASLPKPLAYPVGIDQNGQLADGYEVLDEPWLVLTSASGKILWYYDPSVGGWPTTARLIGYVRAALARSPRQTSSTLHGSPAPLAALHNQASQLFSGPSLLTRIHELKGYPIVLNAWASWCIPCRKEFGLFAAASKRFGRQVAFLGADTNDSASDARQFLHQHPVSYPSYSTTINGLSPLAAVEGLPTTIFLGPRGKVLYVHIGQYDAEGTLVQDIRTYALHRS